MEQTSDDYEIYVGHARVEEGVTSPTLEAAIAAAYERAKGSGHTSFRIVDIIVTGTNPINDYKVVLAPTP